MDTKNLNCFLFYIKNYQRLFFESTYFVRSELYFCCLFWTLCSERDTGISTVELLRHVDRAEMEKKFLGGRDFYLMYNLIVIFE